MQKTAMFLFQNCDLWSISKVTDETLQESHLKFRKSLARRTKHKIFELKKNEQHRIMEDRISFQKQKKTQRSSFKITTCERFQMVNNDASQELCQVRQQLCTT